VAKERRLE
jgi:hypothetical protein